MTEGSAVLEEARRWAEGDPDPATRAEIEALVEAGDADELRERMGALAFGTAGLRGVVGAGPGRMNRAVVLRTTLGLVDWIRRRLKDASALPVVVGFDARTSSRGFAEDVIAVLAAARIPVQYFSEPVPTPVVGYALRRAGANAGIVITASHNPPEYNGYKVFGPNGAQIVPPADRDIADAIARGPAAKDVPRADWTFGAEHAFATPVAPSIVENYLLDVAALRRPGPADRSLRIAYTPLHGVGGRFVLEALRRVGFANVTVVPEQAEPDGRFPTVRFPNPEEAGAMDAVLATARESEANLVLANDPDADRLAAAVPTASGRWVQLTGNQVGILLADFVLSAVSRGMQPLVVSSIVSSPMLGDVARAHGARFEQTLTGFKWIYDAAIELERTAHVRYAFGYEEALGYGVGHIVHDKDGISASVLFAELTAHCRASGVSVLEAMQRLYREHGLWTSLQHSIVRPGAAGRAAIDAAMETLGASPPDALAGHAIAAVTDFRTGAEQRPRWLGEASLVELSLGDAGRVLVRPSGTEPKLKIYVDLRRTLDEAATVSIEEKKALEDAAAIVDALRTHLGLGD